MNKGDWIRGRWFVAAAAIVIAGFIAMPSNTHRALAADSFVKSVEEDHGTYYRLK